MPQRFGLYEDLSIRENLDFVARLYGVPEARRTVGQTLERLGLAERARQLAGQLSGGWKQRLALAACLLHAPRLLLLDEPTAGVDPKARREFWDQIHDLAAAGMTVLVSTHYMDEAERCHEVGYLAGGKLLVHGSVDAVLARSGLTTFEVAGPDLEALAADLRGRPGVEMTAAFGASLHVSGTDPGPARSEHRALPLRPEAPLDQDSTRASRTCSSTRWHARGSPRHEPHALVLASLPGGPDQGIHPDAARSPDVRHDDRRAAGAADPVRLRHQYRPEAAADRAAGRRPGRVRPQPGAGARELGLFRDHPAGGERGRRGRAAGARRCAVRDQHPRGLRA